MGSLEEWGQAKRSGKYKAKGQETIPPKETKIIKEPLFTKKKSGLTGALVVAAIIATIAGIYNSRTKVDIEVDNKPVEVVKEKIIKVPVMKEKKVYVKVHVIRWRNKIIYKDKIIYRDKIVYRDNPEWKYKQTEALKKIEAELRRDKYWIDRHYNTPVHGREIKRTLTL